ncbi:MAG: hypothetical protein Q4C80_04165 [Bacillota bacterium]|nr:hypothetical protein [Bacillota bacterium]
MGRIRGITVTLHTVKECGVDAFNRPIYEEIPVEVENVLVSPTNSTEVLDTLNLTGRKAVYQLAIPKGDNNDWKDKRVTFFGEDFHTFGEPIKGIDELIPLEWNTKVMVEKYE